MTKNQQLRKYISEWLYTPFQWGYHDCVLFAARWADERMKIGEVSKWIGTYDTAYSATRKITEEFGDFDQIFDRWLQHRPIPFASTGDVVLAVPRDLQPIYGIIDADKVILPGEVRLEVYSRSSIVIDNAWRVD